METAVKNPKFEIDYYLNRRHNHQIKFEHIVGFFNYTPDDK